MEFMKLSGLEMQILHHVSEASAREKRAGEEGWLGRPSNPGEEYDEAINRLIKLGAFEACTMQGSPWVRPTQMGESMLAQVQAARSEKQ